MKDKRILYVSSEVVPYLAENEVSCLMMCQNVNDHRQIRILCLDMETSTKEDINLK
jgi:hypothetical protein